MTDRDRIRRPPPERTSPIRRWDGLLGVVAPSGSEAPAAANPPQADQVLARSVEIGYRVVDEYLTRGQEAAQRVRRGVYGAEEIAQDVQSVANQLVRSASDFAGAWVEFFALAGRDATASPATGRAPARDNPGAVDATAMAEAPVEGTAAGPMRVRLSVAAARPVETALDLDPMPANHRLVVQQLRLEADGTIRISDVRVEPGDDGIARIRVGVPNDQTPGRYSATVVDDTTNLPAGELTIIVPPLE